MSATETARFLVETRGVVRDLGAYVVAARFDRGGSVAAFALGDGSVRMVGPEEWRSVPVHDGAVLAMASHPGGGFLTGGDDGAFRRVTLGWRDVGHRALRHEVGGAGGEPSGR